VQVLKPPCWKQRCYNLARLSQPGSVQREPPPCRTQQPRETARFLQPSTWHGGVCVLRYRVLPACAEVDVATDCAVAVAFSSTLSAELDATLDALLLLERELAADDSAARVINGSRALLLAKYWRRSCFFSYGAIEARSCRRYCNEEVAVCGLGGKRLRKRDKVASPTALRSSARSGVRQEALVWMAGLSRYVMFDLPCMDWIGVAWQSAFRAGGGDSVMARGGE
jgi:hypothetical protein